ncbi:glycosyltransferase family 4 protein [Nocardioides furvisabuli]|uniref:glycosyltransferase family 4 protein n=1 Tax=Nocardioides furvisabuli TaxID=375542 RepID=UPI001E55F30A|nr:glycosyltransferase family 4 protein [Nocardioides furvisabuli]
MVSSRSRTPHPAARHVLVVVQNLPVPLDRRVWLECQALRAHGYDVSVICPKGPGDPRRQVIEGVHVYKYRPPPAARGLLGYALEFVYCWVRTALLSRVVWRRQPFHALQACNPPDTYWLLARMWQRRGVRFVFDHHDLNPELFLSRFGPPTSLRERCELRALTWLEHQTFRAADRVISTNQSYRRIALSRGGCEPAMVKVVRSGPDTSAMRPLVPPQRPADDPYVLAYLGIMGPQDGVDTVLDVMEELVRVRGRRDVRAVLMGFGDCLEQLRADCTARGLDDVVTFTGRVDRAQIAEHLSAADIGLCPDAKSPLNDVSTMNKTMEYMAYALPSVCFDLTETRVSGGETACYAPAGDVTAFTDHVERLLDDEDLRVELGLQARQRVCDLLDWRQQAEVYVSVFRDLLGAAPRVPRPRSRTRASGATGTSGPVGWHDELGRAYVDLRAPGELEALVRHRGRRPTVVRLPQRAPEILASTPR